jgi:hypothetical protein
MKRITEYLVWWVLTISSAEKIQEFLKEEVSNIKTTEKWKQ